VSEGWCKASGMYNPLRGRRCIEMADEYPSAQVLGIDLSPEQPTWVPPNCKFEVDDFELEW